MDDQSKLFSPEWHEKFSKRLGRMGKSRLSQYSGIDPYTESSRVEDFGWRVYDFFFGLTRLLTVIPIAVAWGTWDALKENWTDFDDSND